MEAREGSGRKRRVWEPIRTLGGQVTVAVQARKTPSSLVRAGISLRVARWSSKPPTDGTVRLAPLLVMLRS